MTYDEEKKVADIIVALTELIGALESELAHEASHRQKLQNALAYWMPGVTEEIEISTNGRCGDDALLLVGSEGAFEDKCWGNEVLARAEAAEAEAKMLREALHKIESGYGANDICARIARDALSAQVQDVAAKSLADAYQKYLDASDLYNERLAISKTKALGTMRVDEEYRAIDEARRAFDKLAVEIAKSALPAAPAKQEGGTNE